MSRPLLANPKRQSESAKFHREVFARYGNKCIHCGGHATDASHVLRRGMHLGPLRYADPRLARPSCRRCHDAEKPFSKAVRLDAIRAHNKLAKVAIPESAA